MKTPEDALIDVLSSGPAAEGTKAVRTFFLAALAERAADLLDLDRGTVHSDWERLDDARYRSRLFEWGEPGVARLCRDPAAADEGDQRPDPGREAPEVP